MPNFLGSISACHFSSNVRCGCRRESCGGWFGGCSSHTWGLSAVFHKSPHEDRTSTKAMRWQGKATCPKDHWPGLRTSWHLSDTGACTAGTGDKVHQVNPSTICCMLRDKVKISIDTNFRMFEAEYAEAEYAVARLLAYRSLGSSQIVDHLEACDKTVLGNVSLCGRYLTSCRDRCTVPARAIQAARRGVCTVRKGSIRGRRP